MRRKRGNRQREERPGRQSVVKLYYVEIRKIKNGDVPACRSGAVLPFRWSREIKLPQAYVLY